MSENVTTDPMAQCDTLGGPMSQVIGAGVAVPVGAGGFVAGGTVGSLPGALAGGAVAGYGAYSEVKDLVQDNWHDVCAAIQTLAQEPPASSIFEPLPPLPPPPEPPAPSFDLGSSASPSFSTASFDSRPSFVADSSSTSSSGSSSSSNDSGGSSSGGSSGSDAG